MQGWLCCLGCSLLLASSWAAFIDVLYSQSPKGFMQSVGSTQSSIAQNRLQEYSTRDIGWISGLYIFLGLFFGVQAGPLIDMYGPSPLAPIAVLLTAAFYFLLAECTEYWHFMLCLGVLGGVQAALSGTLGIACIGKLFVGKKGLAMGLALSGSSLGGVVYPIMLRELLASTGFKGAFRAIGAMASGLAIVGAICLLPFPRLYERQCASETVELIERRKKFAVMSLTAFRSAPFSYIAGGMVLLEFAIIGISGLLPTFAITAGFTKELGYNLVAILNACSCLGRVLPGFMADRLGHFDVIILMILTTAGITAALFVPFGTSSTAVLYSFAAFWGFGSGSWLSIMPVCVGTTCEPKEYGRFYGTLNWAVSFAGLVALPIGGELLQGTSAAASSGLYLAAVVLGGICFIISRGYISGKMLTFRTGK
ncbi:hypothetical protein N0V90_004570 [Kalmusia sp. IMI 367209]|nr:hypothetical protein N0V90_004570 [Kalmusia sp. IMI 367209]